MKRVLLVEDDEDIKNLIGIHLKDLDCELNWSGNGLEGFELASKGGYDLIILDINLPEKNGLDICRDLRFKHDTTPILMLTARSEEFDKIIGLETGADDYLTKPFSIREFIARIKVIFRREDLYKQQEQAEEKHMIKVGDLIIDKDNRKVSLKGQRIDLTPKEYKLLQILTSNPGRSYSRQQLLLKVWGYDFDGYEHTVNSHINRLRAKIEKDHAKPQYILTSWGVGYRFNDEIDTNAEN